MLNLTNENIKYGIFSNPECEISLLQVQAKKDAEKEHRVKMLSNYSPSLNCKCQTKLPSVLGLIIQMKSCDQETVARFIDSANNDGIAQVNSEIDYLIELSIDYEHPDVTAFLLDYKNKNGLYHDVNWES